ncbi:MAG: hypothetical protein A2Y38_14700 [Spirochaetes bacterium GWB1_59_5]|nr:MAG: hypothetical protein A2Y38_14700 [Spirochaetes bacterium GWB1_59_5]
MSWTCKEVLDKLGDKAQVTARGIIVLQTVGVDSYKHLLVAEAHGDTFHVTPEGKAYLEPNVEDAVIVSEPKKSGGKKKGVKGPAVEAPVVEPVVEDDELDDLDLGD